MRGLVRLRSVGRGKVKSEDGGAEGRPMAELALYSTSSQVLAVRRL